MSKIVILKTALGAPQIMHDLLQHMAVQNPAFVQWLEGFNPHPVMLECVHNALARVCTAPGITRCSSISDYNGISYTAIIGGMKTTALPHGLGVKVDSGGSIQFVADEYKNSWKAEIKRLRELFTNAFLAEVTSAVLNILGYQVDTHQTMLSSGEIAYGVEGVKQ